MTGWNPHWDLDVPYGEDGERVANEVIGWLFESDPRVEVKRKRRLDDWIYVELAQDPGGTGTRWRESGLNVTKADLWAFIIADTGIVLFFPTDLLRWAVRRTDAGKSCAETDGNNPTEGRLFRISWLIQATQNWRDAA